MSEFDAWAAMSQEAREVLKLEVAIAFLEDAAKDAVEAMKKEGPPNPQVIMDWDKKG